MLSGCHMKCHKDHVDREEACITMCNGKKVIFLYDNQTGLSLIVIYEEARKGIKENRAL